MTAATNLGSKKCDQFKGSLNKARQPMKDAWVIQDTKEKDRHIARWLPLALVVTGPCAWWLASIMPRRFKTVWQMIGCRESKRVINRVVMSTPVL